MKEEIKKYWKEFKTGTKTMFKEFFKKETNKKQRANMWTFSRFIIPIISFITSLIALSSPASVTLFIVSGVIAGMGALTDFFDGRSARKHGSTSNYGKLLDQVTDKYFAGVVGINLLFLNPNYIYILIGELAIALINIGYKLKHKDLNMSSSQIGKVKEWPLFLTLGLGFLSPINSTTLLLSNIGVILTLVFQTATAISYIDENNKNIKIQNKTELNSFIDELEEEKDKDLEKEKTKSIEPKSISRLEQCENLRKLKEELIAKEEDKTIEEKGFQKRKK